MSATLDVQPTPIMKIDFRAVFAEFLAMLLFVLICCGCATGIAGVDGWVQQVSLTFGFCITCLAYTVGHHSGGQINCAVTFALVLAKQLPPVQGVANFFGQMAGSLAGAALLALIVSPDSDKTGGLGHNGVSQGYAPYQALLGEIFMTFLLVKVVFETAVNADSAPNRGNAAIAIGFAVYLAHTFLIPIDGCSINPTRSFGPAVVASVRFSDKIDAIWQDHWVFWVGPLLGAALATGVYNFVQLIPNGVTTKSVDVEAPSSAQAI